MLNKCFAGSSWSEGYLKIRLVYKWRK